MDINKPEECTICLGNYDEALLRPRALPCGHTFCSQCIENAIKNGQLTCPGCRAQYSATVVTQFPFNFTVEALIKKFKGTQVASVDAVPAKPCQDPPRGIRKMLCSLVQEQKSSVSSLITGCEEVLSQLGEYQGQLGDWKTHHLQLQDRLYGLVEQNKAAMKLLELEDSSVVDMTTQGEEGKTQLQAMMGRLNTINTTQEAITTVDEAEQHNTKVEYWVQKCRKLFPDVNTVHTSVKVQETIRATLEKMTTEEGAAAVTIHLGDSASTIMKTVQDIKEKTFPEQLSVEDLRRMSELKKLVDADRMVAVRRLVEADRVFALQQDQDGRRSARITLQDGQLFLHPLLHQPMPAHAHTLQHSDIVGVLDPFSTLTFLDLGWAGSTRGRVTIQLTPDTPLARQFLLLCTGQRGHTYLNTKLWEVVAKGEPGEGVVGGDYESNDGKGGASLLPDLQGRYRESNKAGAVSPGWGLKTDRSAQFRITTRDRQDGHVYINVFGEVVSGLELLKAAVSHNNITEVTVVDCGVVLPL